MRTNMVFGRCAELLPKDPRYYQIAVLSSLLLYGVGWLDFDVDRHDIALLLGTARQIVPQPPPPPPAPPAPAPVSTNQLVFTFHMEPAEVGQYLVRLRVDGVDSVPLDPLSDTPQFDDAQKLEVT